MPFDNWTNLLKMMNRVFQFRTMEPTHISILSPRRSETSMSIPQFSFYDHIHLSLHYDENIGNGIIFSLDLTQTYILYDGILRI